MTSNQLKKILLEDPNEPRIVRTNDGRTFRVLGVERWLLANGTLIVVPPGKDWYERISVHNIASIGPGRKPRRRR